MDLENTIPWNFEFEQDENRLMIRIESRVFPRGRVFDSPKVESSELICDRNLGIVEYLKNSPTLSTYQVFNFAEVVELVYYNREMYNATEFHLLLILRKNKQIKLFSGTIDQCIDLGSIITDFLEIPLVFRRFIKDGLKVIGLIIIPFFIVGILFFFYEETSIAALPMLLTLLILYIGISIMYAKCSPKNHEDIFEDIETLEQQIHNKYNNFRNAQVIYKRDAIIGRCEVCNLSIYASEETLDCPECHQLAHRSHLLEWIKIKGFCPTCNVKIHYFPRKKERLESEIKYQALDAEKNLPNRNWIRIDGYCRHCAENIRLYTPTYFRNEEIDDDTTIKLLASIKGHCPYCGAPIRPCHVEYVEKERSNPESATKTIK